MSVGISEQLEEQWGRRVAERRKKLGIRQVRLAELCEVTQQTISKVENGVIVPRDSLKVKIAEALGTRPHLLFPWPGQARP